MNLFSKKDLRKQILVLICGIALVSPLIITNAGASLFTLFGSGRAKYNVLLLALIGIVFIISSIKEIIRIKKCKNV